MSNVLLLQILDILKNCIYFLISFLRELYVIPLVEFGNRHSSRASALSYRHILLLVFLFRILSVCGRWC